MIETIPTEFGELTELQGLYLSKTHVAAKQMIFCLWLVHKLFVSSIMILRSFPFPIINR